MILYSALQTCYHIWDKNKCKRNAAKVIEGEALDLLIGSRPSKDEEKEGVTKFINNLLEKNMVFRT